MLRSLIPCPLHPALFRLPIALAVGAVLAIRRGARPPVAWGVTTALCAALSLGTGWNVARSGGALVDRNGAARAYADTSAAPGRQLEALTDRARGRLAAGDTRSAASSLRAASLLLADASRTAVDSTVSRALTTSARELRTLAAATDGGAVPPARAVDAAVSRARLADARAHHARVMPLVRNLRNAEAGIELLWTVDHLGALLHAAAAGADRGTTALLDDARATALRLTRPELGVPAGTAIVLERLASELDRAARRLAPA